MIGLVLLDEPIVPHKTGFDLEEDIIERSNGLSKEQQPSIFDSGSDFFTLEDSLDISKLSYMDKKNLLIENQYKFQPLSLLFSENRYIPKTKTKMKKMSELDRENQLSEIQNKILEKQTLTETERKFYFSERIRENEEMLDILQYALDKADKEQETILQERILSVQNRIEELREQIR